MILYFLQVINRSIVILRNFFLFTTVKNEIYGSESLFILDIGYNYFYTVYIDAGLGQTNPVTLTFVTSGQSFARSWKIQVSQIRCNTIYRAEEGCLQYFTGISGQIKSFNYDRSGALSARLEAVAYASVRLCRPPPPSSPPSSSSARTSSRHRFDASTDRCANGSR